MRVELLGQPYFGKSIIASAQQAVNVYAESNAGDPLSPVRVTYYLTPGWAVYANPDLELPVRGTYRTSIGTAYVVVGSSLYFLTNLQTLIFIGFIADRPSQVIMADNGLVVVLVDGVNGYVVDMQTNEFSQILDPNFYGASYVQFLDTFFIFNRPDTNQFYISASMANFGMLSNSGIENGVISNVGRVYVNGSYTDVPLIGSLNGTGATIDMVVGGTGVRTGTITNGGTLYTDGSYGVVPLTGGSGAGATAIITVDSGSITVATVFNVGTGYVVGDTLSVNAANVGGTGSGFVFTVDTIGGIVTSATINQSGQGYFLGEDLTVDNTDIGGSGTGFEFTIDEVQSAFDPLDIAAKAGSADPIVAIAAVHKELWLIGELTTEVWIGTGAADFYFQLQQGAYIDHGCIAEYSLAYQDINCFWLMQDKQGKCIVVKGGGYKVDEISTPYLVETFSKYPTIEDAIGCCFQISDHAFYCLIFPTANKTWLYDLTTQQWCEWSWTDANGNFNRHRINCCMFAYGKNLIGDWQNGRILELNTDYFKDGDSPIVRVRTFMHMLDEGHKVSYDQFILDIECGNSVQESEDEETPTVDLLWSDDRGKTYGNAVSQSLGRQGQYLTQPSWNRLGMARDRVFKVQWSAACLTAVNGAWVDNTPTAA